MHIECPYKCLLSQLTDTFAWVGTDTTFSSFHIVFTLDNKMAVQFFSANMGIAKSELLPESRSCSTGFRLTHYSGMSTATSDDLLKCKDRTSEN